MRKLSTVLAFAVLMFASCDEKSEMPPARIAPDSLKTAPQAAPPAVEAAAPSKGVGAAGCASPSCEEACEGHEQPECAEAFALGCFTATPPEDARCDGFAAPADPAGESGAGAAGMPEPDAAESEVKPAAVEIISGDRKVRRRSKKRPVPFGTDAAESEGAPARMEDTLDSKGEDDKGAKATPIGD